MTPVAGANWGGHMTPRPGQEVLVAFQNGNIDRPIIIGTVYNGSGNTDAQGNQQAGSTLQASANAPAFFAGKEAEAHTHNASLSGLKSQQLNASKTGQGGYNQLVFADTPGASRIEAAPTEYQRARHLGHLGAHLRLWHALADQGAVQRLHGFAIKFAKRQALHRVSHPVALQQHRALQNVAQLTNIAWPIMFGQC